MYSYDLFLASMCCGTALCCAGAAMQNTEESGISVSLYQWATRKFQSANFPSGPVQFAVHLNVRNGLSWQVAYGEEEGALLKIQDSMGRSCSGQQYQYFSSLSMPGSRKTGVFTVFTDIWRPSPDATWFQVKGSIPFIVSRTSSMSEFVVLKLVEGFSVPLVLKGAAMDGGDVEVHLKINEDMRWKDGGKEHRRFSIRMVSPVRIGCKGFEIHDEKGMLLPVNKGHQTMMSSGKEYFWKHSLVPGSLTGKEWRVAVSYATGLKRILVPVDIRGGLFGVAEEQGVGQKKGLK